MNSVGELDFPPRGNIFPSPADWRDVFVYFIHEGKLHAPAAAMALIDRLGRR